jgi:hypothetical protein
MLLSELDTILQAGVGGTCLYTIFELEFSRF